VATISRHGKGWRVQIRRTGYPVLSRTFSPPLTKGHAKVWADRAEIELLTGTFTAAKHTLGEAFDKYAKEESPKKRGARWEKLRLAADPLRASRMASKAIGQLAPVDLASWRDARLRAVSAATVRREMNLIDSVLELARKEWKWISTNPLRDVKKPAAPRSRRRRVTDAEIRSMCEHLRGPAGVEVAAGFRLAIETGMRAGEMWSLERGQIDLRRRVVRLLKTKNGDERDVALSKPAVKIVRALLADGRQRLMTSSNATRDALFRKARVAAKIDNLHFHDSRAEAIWRLSKKLDPLELARQIGHRDPKSLLLYYEADAAEMARKLDA
jgi:integrase